MVLDLLFSLWVHELAILELGVGHLAKSNCRLTETHDGLLAVSGVRPDSDGDLRLRPHLLLNSVDECGTICRLDEFLRQRKLEVEFLIKLRSSLDHARLLADAAPLNLDPDLGITSRLNSFNNIQLRDVDDQVAQLFL